MTTFESPQRPYFYRVLERAVRPFRVRATVETSLLRSPTPRVLFAIGAAIVWCAALSSAPGCALSPKAKLPVVLKEDPSAADLKDVVNSNAAKIQSIYSSNATVGSSGSPGWASCRLAFERPGNFRLVGTAALSGRVVDCGCNAGRFWFWSSFQKADELYYCKLDQYQGSALSRVLPLDPTWFSDAFGVVEIKDDEIVDGPTEQSDGSLLVTLKKKRPDGEYRQRIYFEPKTAAILRQDVQNPNGDAVVSVRCKESQFIESAGVVLPKKLEIVCPSSSETLLVDLGTPTVNDSEKIAANAFEQPTDIKATAIDLGAASGGAAKSANASDPASSEHSAPAVAPSNAVDSAANPPTLSNSSNPAAPPTSAAPPISTASGAAADVPAVQGTGLPVDAFNKGTPLTAAATSSEAFPPSSDSFGAPTSSGSVYADNSPNAVVSPNPAYSPNSPNFVDLASPASTSANASGTFDRFSASDATGDVPFPDDATAPFVSADPAAPSISVQPIKTDDGSAYVAPSLDPAFSAAAPTSAAPWQSADVPVALDANFGTDVETATDDGAAESLLIDETRGLDARDAQPFVVGAPAAPRTVPATETFPNAK